MDIDSWIMAHEAAVRLSFFLGVFAVVAAWEILAPRRRLRIPKAMRWTNNLGLVALNTLLLRLLFPAAAVGMAAFAARQGWGLFNYLDAPYLLGLAVSVVVLDFVIWLQHVMVHAIPLLWRLHRVHHADLDYDLTTGARFHPVEIVLSMLIKFTTIAVLGPPVLAVLIFEVLLNTTAMFNHGNLRLPRRLDRDTALARCHPGHAPGASFRRGRRGQQQLRFQPALVGPAVRHLSGSTPERP